MKSFGGRIALYALLTALTAISIDALLPGLRGIAEDVRPTPPLAAPHIISLFVLGMAIGELVAGPLSDAIGRKRTLFIGLAVYAAGTLAALFADSLGAVILGRVLQGIGVAGPKIATRAMIRDQFEGAAMARVLSFMFTLFILVPMLAPALGQGIIALAGWRAVFGFYLLLAVLLGVWLAIGHAETLPAARRIPLRPGLLARNAALVLANRRVALLIVATGFVFGAQLLYLGLAADLFLRVYDVEHTFPLYFAALASGVGLASYLNARLVERYGMDAMARHAFRGMVAAGALMLAASVLFGGRPPLAAFMAPAFAAFFAIGVLFGNLNAMAMRSLGQVAGLGASLIASGSSLVASVFAIGVGLFHDGTTIAVSAGFLLAALAALVLSEWAARSEDTPVRPRR